MAAGKNLRPLFSSHRQNWRTPIALYAALDREFGFTFDPCPPDPGDRHGLLESWAGERVFCNPPYSDCNSWIEKCWTESAHAEVVVALVPARTDTRWWHEYALRADEIRFVRGRLSYDDSPQKAPFPSVILVWNPPAAPAGDAEAERRIEAVQGDAYLWAIGETTAEQAIRAIAETMGIPAGDEPWDVLGEGIQNAWNDPAGGGV